MFNGRQSVILERDTFSDEFETIQTNPIKTSSMSEEESFNARISENYDRIIKYGTMSKVEESRNANEVYQRFTQGVNFDAKPTETTMQFKSIDKSEINKDLRVEESSYQSVRKVNPMAKTVGLIAAAVIVILSVLIIFNTALLKNMNTLIDSKLTEIQMLEQEQRATQGKLDEVSSDEYVLDQAKGYGMVPKE